MDPIVATVVVRYCTASSKEDFLEKILDVFLMDEGVQEGILERENAEQRRYGNDPYKDLAEFKKYDLAGYNRKVDRVADLLRSKVSKLQWGKQGIEVYRALELKDPDEFLGELQKGRRSVGKYWTYSKGMARPYWGKGGSTLVLKGQLPVDSVDFRELVKANTSLAFSADEDEITGLPGRAVFIEEALLGSQT